MRSALRAVAGEEQRELLADGKGIRALVRPPARRRTCSYYDSSDIHVNDYRGRIYSTAITKAFFKRKGKYPARKSRQKGSIYHHEEFVF